MKKLVHDLFFYSSQFSFYLAYLLLLPFYTVFLLCDLFASNCLLLTIDLVALKLQKILETRKLQFTLFNPYFHICLNCQRPSELLLSDRLKAKAFSYTGDNCDDVADENMMPSASFGLLICALISENQCLEKLRSVSNFRKISGPAHLDFVSVCELDFFQVYGIN